MPYSKEQLRDVKFYQEYVDDLRNKYIDRVLELKEDGFRRNGILYSFEDVQTTAGIEDTDWEIQNSVFNNVIDRDDIQRIYSKQSESYPEYIQTDLLEKTVDRNISELSTSRFAETLPDGIFDGDVVTNDDFDDKRIYLIENNQKRIFNDLGLFYVEYDIDSVKTVPVNELANIPDGEEVE